MFSYYKRYTLPSLPPLPSPLFRHYGLFHTKSPPVVTYDTTQYIIKIPHETRRGRRFFVEKHNGPEKRVKISRLCQYTLKKQKTFVRHAQKRTDVFLVFPPNIKWSNFPQKDSQRILGSQKKRRVDRKTCPNPLTATSEIRGGG